MRRVWLLPLASALLIVLTALGPARATPVSLEGLGIAVPTASLQFARYGGRGGAKVVRAIGGLEDTARLSQKPFFINLL